MHTAQTLTAYGKVGGDGPEPSPSSGKGQSGRDDGLGKTTGFFGIAAVVRRGGDRRRSIGNGPDDNRRAQPVRTRS